MSGGKGGKGGNLQSLGKRGLFDEGAKRRKPAETGGNLREVRNAATKTGLTLRSRAKRGVSKGGQPASPLPTLRDAHCVRSSG
jgi:hypothetical protein